MKYKRDNSEWFHFWATLYIKYIDIYKKLEDAYDQLVHPQKRILLKEMLENVMVRLCETKLVTELMEEVIPLTHLFSKL